MKTLDFTVENEGIFITYSPNSGSTDWIRTELDTSDAFVCKKVFHLQKKDITFDSENNPTSMVFKIADTVEIGNEKYYLLDKRVFGISFNLYIEISCRVMEKWLIGERGISILQILGKIGIAEDFFIGGKMPNAISEKEYLQAIKSLPTSTELNKYVQVRAYREFINLIGINKNCESEFKKYLNRKRLNIAELRNSNYDDFNFERYKSILETLKKMLADESLYENVWENEILKFIQILYPQYVICKKQARVKDINGKNRRIDLLLGNSEGNIDILEIKRPSISHFLTKTNSYRDNYIPLRELSGTIMQCEKYIYYLQKGGKSAENDLNKQYKNELPNGYNFHIINPKAIIIIGRSNNFAKQEKEDFEIIRRKYKNVIDIITYDDLINRFETAIKFYEFNKLEEHLQ